MDAKNVVKKYDNGEITITWQPGLCIHSAKCWHPEHGLPEVFNPRERPWIKPENADTDRLIAQINKCPSGALGYTMNKSAEQPSPASTPGTMVEVAPNGPLLVFGKIQVKDAAGQLQEKDKVTAFCRCGASANKPYCDGTHKHVEFVG